MSLVHNEQKPITIEKIGNAVIICKKAGRVQGSIQRRTCPVIIHSQVNNPQLDKKSSPIEAIV